MHANTIQEPWWVYNQMEGMDIAMQGYDIESTKSWINMLVVVWHIIEWTR